MKDFFKELNEINDNFLKPQHYYIKWRGSYIGCINKEWKTVPEEQAHKFGSHSEAIEFIEDKMCMNKACKSIEVVKV